MVSHLTLHEIRLQNPSEHPMEQDFQRSWGDKIDQLTTELAPGLSDVVIKLEDGNYSRLANRLRELGTVEEEDVTINEESAAQFARFLLGLKWPEPSSIGLNDQGEISASWVNRPDPGEEGKNAVPGSVVLSVPADGSLYEVTAMFGVQAPGREWVQVVGQTNDKTALGLLDSVLMRFSNELRTTSD